MNRQAPSEAVQRWLNAEAALQEASGQFLDLMVEQVIPLYQHVLKCRTELKEAKAALRPYQQSKD